MSSGKVVITSNEDREIPEEIKTYISRDIKNDIIVWKFKTEAEAIRAAREFMNVGFETVQRII